MSEVYLQNFYNLTIKLATDNVNELIVVVKFKAYCIENTY